MAMSKDCPLAFFITGPIVDLCRAGAHISAYLGNACFVLCSSTRHTFRRIPKISKNRLSTCLSETPAHISAHTWKCLFFLCYSTRRTSRRVSKSENRSTNIEPPRQLGTDTVSVRTDWHPKA